MGNKTPDPPDYAAAAEQTAAGNLENLEYQTQANRPTQVTPWGTSAWNQGPGGDWTQNITLSPQQQQALNDQMGLTAQRSGLASGMFGQMADEFGRPIDFASGRPLQDAPGASTFDSSERYRSDAEDAIYGQFERRAEPRMQQAMAAMDTQLRNQGLVPGTEAYDYQMSQLRQSQEDARTGAQYQATIGSGAEAERMLGMDRGARGQEFSEGMAGAGFGNQVRQQEIAEEMQRRGFSLNEINAILTGQQVGMPQMPGFNAAGYVGGPDYSGAATQQGQYDIGSANAQNAFWGGMMGGLGGLATGAGSLGWEPFA